MKKIRLMDQPDDFRQLGVSHDNIEGWEDGRRNMDTGSNNWEWWYSDFIFDDGTTAVVQFFTKAGRTIRMKGDHPSINIRIKLTNGTEISDSLMFKADEACFDKNQCNVTMGENCFKGDLQEYHISANSPKGFGVDLKLISQSKPYRPGTAYFELGDPQSFYTWFCTVPKGEVTGTLTYNGETRNVQGSGYHDHQWGSTNFLTEWNHWLWARQRFDDYSILVFDLVACERNGFARFPIAFIQDKNGNIVFENTKNVKCEIPEIFHDSEHSDKDYPKEVIYTFENNGKRVDYHIKGKKILESGGTKTGPLAMKLLCRSMGIRHSYMRYFADGELSFFDGNAEIKRSSELIYEFMFPGDSFSGHM